MSGAQSRQAPGCCKVSRHPPWTFGSSSEPMSVSSPIHLCAPELTLRTWKARPHSLSYLPCSSRPLSPTPLQSLAFMGWAGAACAGFPTQAIGLERPAARPAGSRASQGMSGAGKVAEMAGSKTCKRRNLNLQCLWLRNCGDYEKGKSRSPCKPPKMLCCSFWFTWNWNTDK